MKKLFALALAVLMLFALSSCAEKNKETNVGDIINAYEGIPGGIVDVDINEYKAVVELMGETKYRVSGMLSNTKKTAGILTGAEQYSADLIVEKNKVHIIFSSGQEAVDGEYVEVVGCILDPYFTDTLSDCVITERGNSVRDRIE